MKTKNLKKWLFTAILACLVIFSASAEIVCQFGFEEQQGAAAANSADPSGYSDALLTSETGWDASGPVGGAISLAETSGVDLGSDTLDIGTTQAFSIAFWINVKELPPQFMNIIRKGRYAYPFLLQIDGHGRLYYGTRTSGVQYIIPEECLEINQWYHLAVTFGNNEMVFYINGEVAGSLTNTGSISSYNWDNTYIGSLQGGTDMPGFTGSIDELVIANHTFNQGSVLTLYQGAIAPGTLIFDRSFDSALDAEFYRSPESQITATTPFYTWSIREEYGYVADYDTTEDGEDVHVTSKNDWVVAKNDTANQLVWEKGFTSYYGTPYLFVINRDHPSNDNPNSIAADNEGNVYVTGAGDYMAVNPPYSYRDGPGSMDDMWLIKLDQEGNAEWSTTYNHVYRAIGFYEWIYSLEEGKSVDVDAAGNVYVLISGRIWDDWNPGLTYYSMIKKYSKDGQLSTDWNIYLNDFSSDSLKIVGNKLYVVGDSRILCYAL